jgi:DNA-binding SARP family transcriptional activator
MAGCMIATESPPTISVLHNFELRCRDMPVAAPANVTRMLAFLAVHRRPLHRSSLAAALWMDTSDDRALANLRTALWRARRIDPRLIEAKGQYLDIGPSVQIDLADLIARIGRLERGDAEPELAVDDLADELLPEFYDEWLLVERERLRQLRLHGLELLCTVLSRLGKHGAAVQAGLAAVSAEPLRESGRRVLIEAYLAEGNMSEAVRCFDDFRRELLEQLGIEPSASLRELLRPCR